MQAMQASGSVSQPLSERSNISNVNKPGPGSTAVDQTPQGTQPGTVAPLSDEVPRNSAVPQIGSSGEDQRPVSRGSKNGGRAELGGSTRSDLGLSSGDPAPGQTRTVQNTSAAGQPSARKSRGVSRFLSFLNCCSAPDSANPVLIGDENLPARKADPLQPSQERKGANVMHPNASVTESSTAESKDVIDEKIGGPPYSEAVAGGTPRTYDHPKEALAMPKAVVALPQGEAGKDSEGSQQTARNGEIVSSASAMSRGAHGDGPSETEPGTAANKVLVEPPTPLDQGKETAINDRTPQQAKRDSDIEMADAPAVEQAPNEVPREAERRQAETTQPLPPPPPLKRESASGQNNATEKFSAAQNEKQQWLLPPIQSRFKGKKCLVLDLDETLVHSSFKVSSDWYPCPLWILLKILDSPSSRFHHSRRNRRSVSQCLCN